MSHMRVTVADQVKAETAKHRLLRDRLLAQIPDIDAETLADTLEGITDLREMLAELVRSALEDEALSSGLATRLAEMQARAQRLGDQGGEKASTRASGDDRGRNPDTPRARLHRLIAAGGACARNRRRGNSSRMPTGSPSRRNSTAKPCSLL